MYILCGRKKKCVFRLRTYTTHTRTRTAEKNHNHKTGLLKDDTTVFKSSWILSLGMRLNPVGF